VRHENDMKTQDHKIPATKNAGSENGTRSNLQKITTQDKKLQDTSQAYMLVVRKTVSNLVSAE